MFGSNKISWERLCKNTKFSENYAECDSNLDINDLEEFKKHGWEIFILSNNCAWGSSYSYFKKVNKKEEK
jgi:hypothetical protein